MKAGPSPPEEILQIRKNIDRLRGERSGATVASLADIAVPTWYRKMKQPGLFTIDELAAIARVLDCELKDLVA